MVNGPSASTPPESAEPVRAHTIVVIEDEPQIRRAVKHALATDRVEHSSYSCGTGGSHAHAPADLRGCVGAPLRQPAAVSPCLHHEPSAQDRGEADAPPPDRDRAGRGLPARAATLSDFLAVAARLLIDVLWSQGWLLPVSSALFPHL